MGIPTVTDSDILIEVKGLKKYFPIKGGFVFDRQIGQVKAVDGVSFKIFRGETLGLVGESGSGKTTVGRTLLRLEEPTEGEILVEGEEFRTMRGEKLRLMRQRLQMIFQDPYSSLNPRMKVEALIAEPLELQSKYNRAAIRERVFELMDLVSLPRQFRDRYPHEFSGGQRQRIGIARSLALSPDLIVCDESIASLDVSIQAQIINLLEDLQSRLGLTFLFIAHDLRMVHHISSRIAVMYLGKIMELAPKRKIQHTPMHPYTKALISAIPVPDPQIDQESGQIVLAGDIPSPTNPPKGCVFCTRCPQAIDICIEKQPEYIEIEPEHFIACHLAVSS
jgi:oligopeptide transport system ATP-binding protein